MIIFIIKNFTSFVPPNLKLHKQSDQNVWCKFAQFMKLDIFGTPRLKTPEPNWHFKWPEPLVKIWPVCEIKYF